MEATSVSDVDFKCAQNRQCYCHNKSFVRVRDWALPVLDLASLMFKRILSMLK